MFRTRTSSGIQDLRTIAGIPSGPLNLEVSSWRKVLRALRAEDLIDDIVIVEVGQERNMQLCTLINDDLMEGHVTDDGNQTNFSARKATVSCEIF